ncbi:hypothetical protein BFV93_4791 [Alteromonas macleodii]|nr:hypothetical protein BFV93_4791 [Alteromonas macleodii]
MGVVPAQPQQTKKWMVQRVGLRHSGTSGRNVIEPLDHVVGD